MVGVWLLPLVRRVLFRVAPFTWCRELFLVVRRLWCRCGVVRLNMMVGLRVWCRRYKFLLNCVMRRCDFLSLVLISLALAVVTLSLVIWSRVSVRGLMLKLLLDVKVLLLVIPWLNLLVLVDWVLICILCWWWRLLRPLGRCGFVVPLRMRPVGRRMFILRADRLGRLVSCGRMRRNRILCRTLLYLIDTLDVSCSV